MPENREALPRRKERERIVVDKAYQLSYDEMKNIVYACDGWIRSSGGDQGETAEVWYEDKTYVFSGRGLIDFLYAVKNKANDNLDVAIDLCNYIAQSTKQPASVFVRDAIAARAAELKRKIEGAPDA